MVVFRQAASCLRWLRISLRTESQPRMPPRRSRWRAFPINRALTIVYPQVYRCGARTSLTKVSSVSPSTWMNTLAIRILNSGSAAEFVFLPKFTKAIVFQPRRQTRRLEPGELRPAIHTVSHQDIFRLKMVQKKRRLRGDDHLRLV